MKKNQWDVDTTSLTFIYKGNKREIKALLGYFSLFSAEKERESSKGSLQVVFFLFAVSKMEVRSNEFRFVYIS